MYPPRLTSTHHDERSTVYGLQKSEKRVFVSLTFLSPTQAFQHQQQNDSLNRKKSHVLILSLWAHTQ